MSSHRLMFPLALLVSIVTFVAGELMREPPQVVASSEAEAFSAERAYVILEDLLAERIPHPVGTDANRRVRERIEAFLTAEGIEWEVQRAWGCASKYNNRCAKVENLIAWIPGEKEEPYVAMMAHYDSVPMSPGVGDDGAGLATILETARMLKAEGALRNPLLLIITDAEEVGLLGAEAFFSQHPLAEKVGVVLNVEGAGTTGVSQVLRTFGGNSEIIARYRDVGPHRAANSLTDEVFRRMPNDTDFSVSKRADVPGIDFAFAGEFNHYHTPNDNLDNLDKRTLQHHGDNMFPLVRSLVGSDLDEVIQTNTDRVYFVSLGRWIDWPTWMNWCFVLIGFACLAGIAWRESMQEAGGRKIALLALGPLLVLIVSTVVGLLAFKLVELLAGTIVSWPAELTPFRLVLYAAPLFGAFGTALWLNRYLDVSQALVGGWLTWLGLGVLMTILMPGATHALLGPLVPGLILVFAATLIDSAWLRSCLLALSLVVAVNQTLGFVPMLEDTQGFRLAFVNFPLIALFVMIAGPLARGRLANAFVVALGVAMIWGVFWAGTATLYSSWRPQHVNVRYLEDVDAGNAYMMLASPNPSPPDMLSTGDMTNEEVEIYPWTDWKEDDVAFVGPSGWHPPEIEVVSDAIDGDLRVLDLSVRSPRAGMVLQMMVPTSVDAESIVVEGIEMEATPVEFEMFRDFYVIMLFGMRDEPVSVQLRLRKHEAFDAWLSDSSTTLPAIADDVLALRAPLATPAHQGDRALLVRRFSF